MANLGALDRQKKGQKVWNRWAKEILAERSILEKSGQWFLAKDGEPENESTRQWMTAATTDFTGHEFYLAPNFKGFIFPYDVSFANCNFSNEECDPTFESVVFHGRATFFKARFRGGPRFENATFFGRAEFTEAEFGPSTTFTDAKFKDLVSFSRSKLRLISYFEGVTFAKGATLSGASMNGCRMQRMDLSNCRLVCTDLRRAEMDQTTHFGEASVEGCIIDRYSLECLNNYGGLSVGARMKMDIRDDFEMLNSQYSGFQQWIHLAAILSFLLPYFWFVTVNVINSELTNNPAFSIPLWQAIAQYIYNGGNDWKCGFSFHWSFWLFCGALFYNFIRIALLFKTKKLELIKETSGIPVYFNFREQGHHYLESMYWISKNGFPIYLIIVFINSGYFLTRSIPI